MNCKGTFIATDVANLEAEGFLVAFDSAVPEVLGFGAIEDDKTQAVYLYLGVAMPGGVFVSSRTVNTQPLDGLQTFIAD